MSLWLRLITHSMYTTGGTPGLPLWATRDSLLYWEGGEGDFVPPLGIQNELYNYVFKLGLNFQLILSNFCVREQNASSWLAHVICS